MYPYVSRSYVPSPFLTNGIIGLITSYIEQGEIGWEKVALLSSTDGYGISMSNGFINGIKDSSIQLLTYQQFIVEATDVSVEIREIQKSGARVIITFAFGNYKLILEEADRAGLLDDNHVFFVGSTLSGFPSTYSFPNGTIDYVTVERMKGTLACQPYIPRDGDIYNEFREYWRSLDPTQVAGSGNNTEPPLFPTLASDSATAISLAVQEAEKQGFTPENPPTGEQWSTIIRQISFDGVTGFVEFDEKGDRLMTVALVNFLDNASWQTIGTWTIDDGVELFEDKPIIWFDNTTNIPDLDIRPKFDYWSCDNKEKRTDETGKTIELHTPDGDSFDDIDYDYHCDLFIDCHNISDESVDCATNYVIIFIVFGVVTLLLIFIALLFLFLTILFGLILKYQRLRVASPYFLIILLISILVGFCSIFSWYGKPHPVACAFQPWLLGLATISMINVLTVKNFRIYRIFKYPLEKTRITDIELFIYWCIVMIPGVLILILWAIISTPTAKMEERNGENHYVCTTGGFTGEPGGYIFFFIFVAYSAVVIIIGAIVSILARNCPSTFNETRLLTISIYNLGFLGAIIIPVVLVVQSIYPVAAWILRTSAILYAFSATMFLQFGPKFFAIFCIDKFKHVKVVTDQRLIHSSGDS